MRVLVEVAPGQAPVALTVDELRSSIIAGRVQAMARASRDEGATWALAWQAAGLPPPQSGNDAALRMIVPVGRSIWAIVAGYLALLLLIFGATGWGITVAA